MKIALIGNMNNNNFAMMRYFRDLGADAHLFLYSNDGVGTLGHFRPEDDTFEIEKWRPYIHRLPIANSPVSAFNFPANLALAIYEAFRWVVGLQKSIAIPVSKKTLNRFFSGYELILCCGIAPAALIRINRPVDIFTPYSAGVEFFMNAGYLDRPGDWFYPRRWFIRKVSESQAHGLRAARYVCTADAGMTTNALNVIGIDPVPLAMPMVYISQSAGDESSQVYEEFAAIEKNIAEADLSIVMHARLAWSESDGLVRVRNKNNHWLIYAFKELIRLRPSLRVLLVILEYGPHVQATKKLVRELELEANVLWLPQSPRKQIQRLLSKAHIGVGEFIISPGTLWGGTGWEVLASGKPLLQAFNFKPGQFEKIYGYSAPPMLSVQKREDILAHLLEMADRPDKRERIALEAKAWFDRYNGIGLAKQWLDLLEKNREVREDFIEVEKGQDAHG